MPVALTTLRTTIATALVDNAKWQTFAFPPATVLAKQPAQHDCSNSELQDNYYCAAVR